MSSGNILINGKNIYEMCFDQIYISNYLNLKILSKIIKTEFSRKYLCKNTNENFLDDKERIKYRKKTEMNFDYFRTYSINVSRYDMNLDIYEYLSNLGYFWSKLGFNNGSTKYPFQVARLIAHIDISYVRWTREYRKFRDGTDGKGILA